MIDRTQLRELHGGDLPLHILEQDYVQALFLQELYRETDALVFKGGTFLKHAHGLDRFSEDLDFTRLPESAVADQLATAADGLDRYGLPAEIDDVDRQANAVLARLRYEGPLFDGTDRSRGHIDIDVSTREDVFRDPEWRRLFVPYPEARAVTARCLAIEEAFAEKLRALSTRSRGRDLYDCWFLLHQDVPIDPDLFARKMDVLGKSARVRVSIDDDEWNRDLSVLVEHPPAYQTVIETVTEALGDAGVPVQIGTA
jgi:predicted nucleotidyltransferase component of viral defense system